MVSGLSSVRHARLSTGRKLREVQQRLLALRGKGSALATPSFSDAIVQVVRLISALTVLQEVVLVTLLGDVLRRTDRSQLEEVRLFSQLKVTVVLR